MSLPRFASSATQRTRRTTPLSACESRHRPGSATLRSSPSCSYDHCWVQADEQTASLVPTPALSVVPRMSRHRSAARFRRRVCSAVPGTPAGAEASDRTGGTGEPGSGARVRLLLAPVVAAGSAPPSSFDHRLTASTVASRAAETPAPASSACEGRCSSARAARRPAPRSAPADDDVRRIPAPPPAPSRDARADPDGRFSRGVPRRSAAAHRTGRRSGGVALAPRGSGGTRDSAVHPTPGPPPRGGIPKPPRNRRVARPRAGSRRTPRDAAGHPATRCRHGESAHRAAGCRNRIPCSARVPGGRAPDLPGIGRGPVPERPTRCPCPCPTGRPGRIAARLPPRCARAGSGPVREDPGMPVR